MYLESHSAYKLKKVQNAKIKKKIISLRILITLAQFLLFVLSSVDAYLCQIWRLYSWPHRQERHIMKITKKLPFEKHRSEWPNYWEANTRAIDACMCKLWNLCFDVCLGGLSTQMPDDGNAGWHTIHDYIASLAFMSNEPKTRCRNNILIYLVHAIACILLNQMLLKHV